MIINRKFIFALLLLFGILTQTKCGQLRGNAFVFEPSYIRSVGRHAQVEARGHQPGDRDFMLTGFDLNLGSKRSTRNERIREFPVVANLVSRELDNWVLSAIAPLDQHHRPNE
jgi:hypothetical protein